jgi:predicted dienelactone hydrolase
VTLLDVFILAVLVLALVRAGQLNGKAPQHCVTLASIGLLAMTVQVVSSGIAWQMIPASIAALLLFLWGMARWWQRGAVPRRRAIMRVIIWAVGGTLLGTTLALTAAFPVFQFPPPSGPYPIGTVIRHWTDPSRGEPHSAHPEDRRELMVRFWYPAQAAEAKSTVRASYLAEELPAYSLASHPAWPFYKHPLPLGRLPIIGQNVPLVVNHFRVIETGAVPGARVSDVHPRFPVLIFNHCFGIGDHLQSTALVEDLASHGYIVASINHTFGSHATAFPDGRIVRHDDAGLGFRSVTPGQRAQAMDRELRIWADDVRFVLDRLSEVAESDSELPFAGRMDMSRVGVFGHSFGGQAAIEACRDDDRCRAGAVLDGWGTVRDAAVDQPFLFIQSQVSEAGEIAYHRQMKALYDTVRGDGYYLRIRGAGHLSFMDLALMSPLVGATGLTGSIDARRGLRLVGDYLVAFFDKYLQSEGEEVPALDGPLPEHTEVLFELRRAQDRETD